MVHWGVETKLEDRLFGYTSESGWWKPLGIVPVRKQHDVEVKSRGIWSQLLSYLCNSPSLWPYTSYLLSLLQSPYL